MNICPRCQKLRVLSDTYEHRVEFNESLCEDCRQTIIRELQRDAFDDAYDRAIAEGWSD